MSKGTSMRLVDAVMDQVKTAADTNETDLASITIPANTITQPKERLRIRAWGTFAANTNTKRIRAYFGGTLVADSGAIAAHTGHWEVEVDIFLKERASQRAFGKVIAKTTAGTPIDAIYTTQTLNLAKDELTALIAKVTGLNGTGNADDITGEGLTVEASE